MEDGTNIFVYGSLMFDVVWSRVVMGKYHRIKATVEGFKRLAVIGQTYPALTLGDGIVDGIVWREVGNSDLARLDNFESEPYQRVKGFAKTDDRNELEVQLYLIREEYADLLDDKEWNVDEFRRHGLRRFMSDYFGFDKINTTSN